MHEPLGRLQFVVFEKFTSAYLHQIERESMLLLVNKLHEKRIAGDLCNLHSCYMKNALVFSKRDARNLFIRIITSDIQAVLCYRSCCKERGGVMASALVRDLTG